MRPALLLLFTGLLGSSFLTAQCGLAVDAGPDAFYCPGGGPVQLNGSISGPGLSGFSWSPSTGLSNPNSLTPVATVSSPTSYTLTAEVFDPTTNVIINGDFEAGNTGFTTDYDPGSGGAFGTLSDEGEFTIATNSSATHTNFSNCPDHTGGGNMMVVNGSAIPNENVWCQTVMVTTNTTYAFNAWLQSVHPDNPARLQFSVNGTLLGSDFRASSSACNWLEFTETWPSGSATSAEICITNQNTQPSGNDFAIDDLFFGEVCTQTDDVFLDEVFIDADAVPTAELMCDGFGGVSAILDGGNSSGGPNTFYQWTTTDGNIVSGATTRFPTVNQPGTYRLTARYDDGIAFCTDVATVVVAPVAGGFPTANAVIISSISCTTGAGTLGVTGSSAGDDFIYDWSTTAGNIIAGAMADEATIDRGGTYTLLVTNTVSGCTATATVDVVDNRRDPVVIIDPPAVLTCANPTLTLDATGSDGGTNFTPSWSTSDGNILTGEDGLTPVIDQIGTYELTIEDSNNGCSTTRTVMVMENKPEPALSIAPPEALTCQRTELRLDGTGSAVGADIRYTWTTIDGNIVANADSLQPLVNAAGTYLLTVTDGATGCDHQDSVTVRSTVAVPNIAFQSPQLFTCVRAQVLLDASASTSGSDYSYAWSTSNGGTLSGPTDSLRVIATAPGDYTLRITNNLTGCFRDTILSVGENTTPPVAAAGTGFTLACTNPSDTLDGRGSSQGPNFTYTWTTTAGNLSGNERTLRPLISRAGTYQLVVLDTINGCFDTARVTIGEDNNAPIVNITPPDTLTCRNPVIGLDASSSTNGTNLVLEWTTPDGNFLAGTDGLTPDIDASGTYQLSIFDPANGCRTTGNVVVAQDTISPLPEAGPGRTLTCYDPTNQLLASDPGAGFSFAWSTTDGQFNGPINTLSPTVRSGGTYQFQVTNNVTGCTATDHAIVSVNQALPTLSVNPGPDLLTCRDTVLTLNPSGTPLPNYTYNWQTTDGQITRVNTLPSLTVSQPGRYALAVVDTINGCGAGITLSVTQDTTPPTVLIEVPPVLNCAREVVTLTATGSSTGPGFQYTWQTDDGQIASPATATAISVDQPGTYQLRIENVQNGCLDSAATVVQQDTITPVASIADPIVLTCFNRAQNLNGSTSSNGPAFSYQWTTNGGNISGGTDQTTAVVDAAGQYFLTVRNDRTACVGQDSIIVMAAQTPPVADAGQDQRVTCQDRTANLGADAGAIMGLSYAWSTISGGMLAATDQPRTTVQQAGVYQILVTNQTTGCAARDTVVITADQVPPIALVPDVRPLNCAVRTRTLTAAPAAPGRTYLANWTTTNGNIIGTNLGPSVQVDAGGDYRLRLVDPANGCVDSIDVRVAQDTIAPNANIGVAPTLTCRNRSVQLDGQFSSSGPGFAYTWSTVDGNILSGGTGLRPQVAAAGLYVLTVRNSNNNCSSTASVRVDQFDQPPLLAASPPAELTCLLASTELRARRTGPGESFAVSWTTTDGNIVSGASSLAPTVDQPGTYLLTVVNRDTECQAELPVTVTQDIRSPVVSLGEDFDLGCEDVPVSLEASASGPGPFDFAWSTTNGQLVANSLTARPLVQGPGTYVVTVTSKTNGCTTTADIRTSQALLLGFAFTQRDPTCRVPLGQVAIGAVEGGTAPYLFNLGGNSFRTEAFADSLPPGRYPLIIQDANGCEVSGEATIPNVPVLDLYVDPQEVITLGDRYFINTQTNFADSSLTQISWTPGLNLDCTDCLRPTASPTATTVYTIMVESTDGCRAQDSIRIIVDILRPVYFPTAFSPNGDGINDAFLPFGNTAQIVRIVDFQVFDRWGESVFSNTDFQPNDPAAGWDGRLSGRPMNPAVFVYSASVEFVDGQVVTFKGDVVLVR